MAGAALLTFFTARRLFNPSVAFAAALLFATNPTTVTWAQKARPYGVQTLLVAIALWGFVAGFLALRDQRRWLGAGLIHPGRETGALRADLACLAYAACAGLAMLAQHQAGFFVFGCNCAMLVVLARLWGDGARAACTRLFWNWVFAQILLIGIWALWLPFFIQQYQDHLTSSGLRTHANYLVSTEELWSILTGLLGTSNVWRLKSVFFGIFMACAIPAGVMLARDRSDRRLILIVFLVPLLVCLGGFAVLHPVFGYVIMTFAWLLIPYCIVLAAGAMALPWHGARLAVLGLLVAINAVGLRNYYARAHQPLDQAAAVIARDIRADDGFMVSTTDATRKGIGYYLRRAGADGVLDVSVFGPTMVRSLPDALRHPRLWVVLPTEEIAAVDLALLGTQMRLAAEHRFADLRVLRFERLAQPPR
jgi:4-amino-4-deoxy-L-arabinose transferase-like glycosyltransferase